MTIDCYCDYDAPEFYTVEHRTARKEHRCYECSGRILPGEKYQYSFGKWDGDIGEFHTCERCLDLRQWTQNNVPCLCWAHGSMTEKCKGGVEEAASRAPKETIGLRFGFLRRLALRDRFNRERRAAS